MPNLMPLSTLSALSVFPYADQFNHISDAEVMELATDIEANGLIHPIVLFENQILDGRNRLRALLKTNLTSVPVEEFVGTEYEAAEHVVAVNVLRRHMSAGQRAFAALDFLPYEEAEAEKRKAANGGDRRSEAARTGGAGSGTSDTNKQGKARDLVAVRFSISGQRISEAKKLRFTPLARQSDQYGIDLEKAVMSGAKSLDWAVNELARREAEVAKRRVKLDEEAELKAWEASVTLVGEAPPQAEDERRLWSAKKEADRLAAVRSSLERLNEDEQDKAIRKQRAERVEELAAAFAKAEKAVATLVNGPTAADEEARRRETQVGELIRRAGALDELLRQYSLTDIDVAEFPHLEHTFAGVARRLGDWFSDTATTLEASNG